MSVFKPGNKPPERQPSLSGGLMLDASKGKIRARGWPRKRGRPKTTEEKERQEAFRWTQFASKYVAPQMMVDIMESVAHSPLLPRDITTMMFYNRLFKLIDEKGTVYWPMEARQDISEALDAISQTVGDGLIRTPDGWAGQPVVSSGGLSLLADIKADGSSGTFDSGVITTMNKHLLIFANPWVTSANNARNGLLTFNNDNASNYQARRDNRFGAAQNMNFTSADVASFATTSASTTGPGLVVLFVPFYSDPAFSRNVYCVSSQRLTNEMLINFATATWRNATDPITSVQLRTNADNLVAGSRMQVWGI